MPETPKAPRNTRKPAEKKSAPRTVEQLEDATTRSMTPAEMSRYIEFLRNERASFASKAQLLEENCKSAYDLYRNQLQKYDQLKMQAQAKLQFARQAVQTCSTSIILAGGLED